MNNTCFTHFKKKINVNFENAFDNSEKNKSIHDKVFSDLFLMFRNTKIGVNGYKYPISFFLAAYIMLIQNANLIKFQVRNNF